MNFTGEDVLKLIPDKEVSKLRDLYEADWPTSVHIYNFLDTYMLWRKFKPHENCIRLYCPDGDFEDGTFVAVVEILCYDVVVHTLDKSMARLKEALRDTRMIDWCKKPLFAAVHEDLVDMVVEVRDEINFSVKKDNLSYIWCLPKEKALAYTYDVPLPFYVAPIKKNHVELMNSVWPHRCAGSDKYLEKLIDLNGGIGLFLKSNNELCCWILKNYFGGLGILQTTQAHQGNGYSSLITKIFAKIIAQRDEHDIIGFIVDKNVASKALFKSLGFKKVTPVRWCEC